jgi:hypothetical protein
MGIVVCSVSVFVMHIDILLRATDLTLLVIFAEADFSVCLLHAVHAMLLRPLVIKSHILITPRSAADVAAPVGFSANALLIDRWFWGVITVLER